jgi:hypothetical protein
VSGGALRRRHLFRDETRALEVAAIVNTHTARAFTLLPSVEELAFIHSHVLVAVAHFMDMAEAAGTKQIVYADDIAAITGYTEARAAGYLRDICRKTGLIAGSAAAGYTLAGRMIE